MTDATVKLTGRDPALDALIDRHGIPPRRPTVRASDRFAALTEAIVYQQLAGKAAASIHGRLVAALDGTVTPESVLAAEPSVLAGCGLSAAKAGSIRELAERASVGDIAFERIGRLSDDEIVEHLTRVRGIGPWTAHMFLLITLGRPDVWPTGDFGVRAGFARAWALPAVPTPKQLAVLGEPFRPYRSLVAWYCWRELDMGSAVT